MPSQNQHAAAAAGAATPKKNEPADAPIDRPNHYGLGADSTAKSLAFQGLGFDRNRLPDPLSYFESIGLVLEGRGKWRTAPCVFHGGSDSMRINTETGAFVCMAGCGARGGDVLAYHRAVTGDDFVAAAKALGAWVDGGRPAPHRPAPFAARDALELLAREATLIAVAACNVGHGVQLSDEDRQRLLQAAGRVRALVEASS